MLCPAYVPTGIADSERNRPAGIEPTAKTQETLAREALLRKAVSSGRLSADDVARTVVQAVKEAGKAAAAAVGRRLSNEIDEIKKAAKDSKAGARA